jgi:hypothetical protein
MIFSLHYSIFWEINRQSFLSHLLNFLVYKNLGMPVADPFVLA